MQENENSLILDFKNRTATAKGRFAILSVLAFVFAFVGGVTYFGGTQLMERFSPQITASIAK